MLAASTSHSASPSLETLTHFPGGSTCVPHLEPAITPGYGYRVALPPVSLCLSTGIGPSRTSSDPRPATTTSLSPGKQQSESRPPERVQPVTVVAYPPEHTHAYAATRYLSTGLAEHSRFLALPVTPTLLYPPPPRPPSRNKTTFSPATSIKPALPTSYQTPVLPSLSP